MTSAEHLSTAPMYSVTPISQCAPPVFRGISHLDRRCARCRSALFATSIGAVRHFDRAPTHRRFIDQPGSCHGAHLRSLATGLRFSGWAAGIRRATLVGQKSLGQPTDSRQPNEAVPAFHKKSPFKKKKNIVQRNSRHMVLSDLARKIL